MGDGTHSGLAAALDSGLVDEDDTSVVLVDVDVLERQVERVRGSFPPSSVHAVAVKTNPLRCVLSVLAGIGAHAEAASFEELVVARHAGFGDRLIWDSPAKTRREIDTVAGWSPWLINVDSFEELARYDRAPLRLGLRVNPERSPDTIASLATGVPGSKFGIGLSQRREIVDAFLADERLRAIHVHSGSNSRSLDPMVEGVAAAVDLAEEINEGRGRMAGAAPVEIIDIGGGLPCTAGPDEMLSVERYAAALKESVPRLFDGTYRIATEFGRFYHQRAASTAMRVEYVKETGGVTNVVVHLGADAFVREVYDREHWQVQFRLHCRETQTDSDRSTRVVGPLCFEGDVLDDEALIGRPVAGDWLIAEATGANTFSLWSRHCSRAFPKVLLYRSGDPTGTMRVGKQRESLDRVVDFWS